MSSMLPIRFREMIRPMRMMEQMRIMQEELTNPHYFPSVFRSSIFNQHPWRLEYKDNDESSVFTDKEKFLVKMNVQHFEPSEITVKIADHNTVVVEAKHEEKTDEKGFISRQMVRRFSVPEGHDLKQIASSLSSDGMLTITAPKNVTTQERIIPITQTGPVREEKKEIDNESK